MRVHSARRRTATAAAALVLAAGLMAAGGGVAQEAHYPAGGPKLPEWSDLPDWNGIWERGGDIVWDDRVPFKPGEPEAPPYNEHFMKDYLARRAEMRAVALEGRPRNMRGGDLYGSMPAMMIALFPLNIVVNPREVVIMTPNGGAREIYTDGRAHPVDPLPSTKGHSIGHWEGKVLVVDTCCIKASTRLPGGGSHSDAMHISERIWSPDGKALKDTITVEDPKAFSKPWATEKTYYRRPTWETVEYDAQENSRDFGAPADDKEFGPPVKEAAAAPPPPVAPPKPKVAPVGKPATIEDLQRATARAVGNLAWETVDVQDVKRASDKVAWVGATRSVNWRCGARSDGAQPFCEAPVSAQPAKPAAAAQPARLAAAAQSAGPAAPAQPGVAELRRNAVSVDGQDRGYFYYIPANADRAGFNQIVYALHDNGQTAAQFADQSGWTKLADANGFIVVFPEALQKQWGPSTGGEDAYVKAVLSHAPTHLMLPAPGGAGGPGGGGGGGRRGGGGEGGAPAGGEGGMGRGGGDGGIRLRTWAPFQYLTGVGEGATVAQGFAMNHPGLYAAVATFGGSAYDEAYARGEEPSEGAYLHLWAGKALTPIWKQRKKDVPATVWLFGAGKVDDRQANYWKQADRVAPAGATASFGGYQTTVYAAPDNAAQQVRTTVLPAGARFDANVAGTIWNDMFSRVVRWTSSPNGDVAPLMTKAEVEKAFTVRTVQVGDRTYTYYVKTPSSYRKGKSLPVVLAAHGFAFPAWQYASQIRMHEVGEKEGFITVYLQGQNNAWNFDDPEGPDSQYVQKVIAAMKADYKADPQRIYMQGFSFGSGLTYAMGLTHPQLFAAVSPNSGIGPMPKDVEARIAEVKAKGDIRIPMMLVYGTADRGGTIDGEIPDKGILQGAIDQVKAYNRITTADTTQPFQSPTGPDYRTLVPGGTLTPEAVDPRYPQGRFKTWTYASADPAPRDLLKFVWVLDLTHGGDPRQAQLEWDYFKHWRRNADGSLTYSAK